MIAELPASLVRWSTVLSLLDPELAIALGPMVRRLDDLVSSGDRSEADAGEVDGYRGLARRGEPHRIVASEWALADEVPNEFLRRAVNSELLYLGTNWVRAPTRGRIAVVVDAGPDQLGAGRLVQLATIVVLQRRAERRGATLTLSILGDPVGSWKSHEPIQLLDIWLTARRTDHPDAGEVGQWAATLERPDEMWVLAGSEVAAALPGRRRVVTAAECAWSGNGATAVEVLADGHRAELNLPRGEVAIRALRSVSLRMPRAIPRADSPLRHLTFADSSATLLARGRDVSEIVRIAVPRPDAAASRPKIHRFSGPVITASVIGRRVVALVQHGEMITVEVIGKHLAAVENMIVPLADLDLTQDAATVICDGPLGPLVFDAGDLVVRLVDQWWRVSEDSGPTRADDVVTVLATGSTDQPQIARRIGDRTLVTHRGLLPTNSSDIVLGSGDLAAWPEDRTRWHVAPYGRAVLIGEGDTVLAVHTIDDAPALVTASHSGLTTRLRWPAGQRTLTAWSGDRGQLTVHRTRPLIASIRPDGVVQVGNLVTGAQVLRVDTST